MYLEMIFGKNKEQTMRQLQFKFDPLPTESTRICLFHQRWIKNFDTQPFCQLCIKYVLVFYKNNYVQFRNKYMVGPSQKKLISGTRKMENVFFAKKLISHDIFFKIFILFHVCYFSWKLIHILWHMTRFFHFLFEFSQVIK